MRKSIRAIAIAVGGFLLVVMLTAVWRAQAQDNKTPYPSMAPVEQYLMERSEEITLARSAAPQGAAFAKARGGTAGDAGQGVNFAGYLKPGWLDSRATRRTAGKITLPASSRR
jgi:hypothetical protein